MKNIVLIGFMGTGKTAVGRRLAARLNREFVDTDAEIERITGKTVAQIFEKDGPVRFRSEEALLVKKLCSKKGMVISTGGGMVLNHENVELLGKSGVLIALKAEPDVICRRLKNKRNRPLLLKGDLKENVLKLLEQRRGIYDVAEYTVDTSELNQEAVVDLIIDFLSERNLVDGNSPG
ncbi:MAG TPA: shikimate kinase [Bacillota bacterium]|nr:shikimate kinase [Bacillota bacterium]